MEVVFSLGVLVLGVKARFWTAVGVAVVHVTAVAMIVASIVRESGSLRTIGGTIYLAVIAAAIALYRQNRALPKEHPRRETSEMLGALGYVGAALLVVGAVLAFGIDWGPAPD